MWRVVDGRATGTSHVKAGLSCQDRSRWAIVSGGTLVAAIADGAGSALEAERGAELAVETVITCLSEAIQSGRSDFEEMLREAAAIARQTLIAEASKDDGEARDFACTLLATIVGPAGGAALQIGDGVIVAGASGDEWAWVFWPQRGEYANTTRFLTDADAAAWVQAETFAGHVTDIALLTDGLEPLALHYASKSVHQPFFRGMFQPLIAVHDNGEMEQLSAALAKFLSSERVRSRTDDDVSVLLASRRRPQQPPD